MRNGAYLPHSAGGGHPWGLLPPLPLYPRTSHWTQAEAPDRILSQLVLGSCLVLLSRGMPQTRAPSHQDTSGLRPHVNPSRPPQAPAPSLVSPSPWSSAPVPPGGRSAVSVPKEHRFPLFPWLGPAARGKYLCSRQNGQSTEQRELERGDESRLLPLTRPGRTYQACGRRRRPR